MKQRPKGAITSTAELQKLTYVWEASHKFKTSLRVKLTGDVGVITHSDGSTYEWWEEQHLHRPIQHSLMDRNIPELNGYNDWFLFSTEADAEAYKNGGPAQ